MRTRLALFCDKLIEAGWLGVAVLIPLFFNVYSARVFEPDKLTVFRGIALIMLVAWLVKTIENWSPETGLTPDLRRLTLGSPLRLAALVFAGLYIFATVTSIEPGLSFWGSYQRLQGTLNNLGYVTLFLLTVTHLRTRAQLERLFSVILLTSLPIALYGVVQHFGRDPLPWGGDVRDRVTSSMGNPIFLGAYLIMVVPLTLARLVGGVRGLLGSRRPLSGLDPRLVLVALYLALLVLQLVVILYTKSRGPWLGLGAGMASFALLVLLRWRQRVLFGVSVGGLAILTVFVVLLNISGSPLAGLRDASPYLSRLGTMLETESGTNRVRVLIWAGDEVGKGSIGLITANPYRFLVGYGPETMYVAYNPHYPPDLAHLEARNASPDRSHNDLLDFMVTMGLVGLLGYLALVGVFIFTGLRLLWRLEDHALQLVVIALLAGVAAHLVETFFGIAIAATRTHFWLFLASAGAMPAILGWGESKVAVDRRSEDVGAPVPEPVPVGAARSARYAGTAGSSSKARKNRSGKRPQPPRRESMPPAMPGLGWDLKALPLLFYLLLSAVGTPAILMGNVGQRLEPPQLVVGGFAWAVVGLLLVAVWVDRPAVPRLGWRGDRIWLYVPLVFVATYIIVWPFLGSVVADIYFKKGQAYDNVQRFEGSVPAYLQGLDWAPNQDFYYLFLGRAYLELAKRMPDQPSTLTMEKVEDLRKLNFAQPQGLGRDLLFNASLVALKRARDLNRLNTDNSANLARLHRFWGEMTADPAKRQERFDLAVDYYLQAIALSPNAAHLYDEWGVVYHIQGRYAEAEEKYQRALALDQQYPVTFVYLGDAYLAQNKLDEAAEMYRRALEFDDSIVGAHSALGFIYQRQGRLADAVAENEKAARLAPNDLVTRRNLAVLYNEMGNRDKALTEAEAALRLAPKDQQPPLQAFIDQLKQGR